MSELDLFTLLAMAAVGLLVAAGRFSHAANRFADRHVTVEIPEGQIVMAVRTATPISSFRWREIQAAATNLAAALRPSEQFQAGSIQVHALGPVSVRRDGREIRQLGGAKAGSRQALAVLAFLLDRGDRGAHKDEILEMIWPDVDIERADLAFHRTLNGLRTVLSAPAPELRPGLIFVKDGVYRLRAGLVSWFDVDSFEAHLCAIEAVDDPGVMEAHLAALRRLYRGDYMDDCPFFGDSSQVEVRRQLLRDRYASALRAVAEARERGGRRAAAGQLFREALVLSGQSSTDEAAGPQLMHPAA